MKNSCYIFILFFSCIVVACSSSDEEKPEPIVFKLNEVHVDGKQNENSFTDVNPNSSMKLVFSDPIDENTIAGNIRLQNVENKDILFTKTLSDNGKTVEIKPNESLKSYAKFKLNVYSEIKSKAGAKILTGRSFNLQTTIDLSDKFPRISDEELLDLVQKQTFSYFWDYGHPTSGMARERTTSGNTVTTGGTGFGVMAIVVAAERGYIKRAQAAERILKIVTFLDQKCEKYHGAYAHWVNGETGTTIAFSAKDDGADIVETALLFQGLLTARQYFSQADASEIQIKNTITRLWENIEWTWFQRNNEKALSWHWSKNYGWDMNMRVRGWNEGLIVYVLAASSPTYAIAKEVYDEGWAHRGAFANNQTFYGIKLPLGPNYGGPLFFSHYSFVGINPKDLTDQYTNYWEQNRSHTLINYNHSVNNPNGYGGYSSDCWGLTACDGDKGYSAHSPTNDRGVIAPTAALSSMPYTPNESMQALSFFYYKLGDKLWSEYGFYDAFNLSAQWFDNQHIAIDQGPIILMIENYRSGLLWSTFMSIPEIKNGMKELGFKSPNL